MLAYDFGGSADATLIVPLEILSKAHLRIVIQGRGRALNFAWDIGA
jgi:hypothetical protein